MERAKHDSTAFAAQAYDPADQLLELQFHPRKKDNRVQVGQYFPVSQGLYDELMNPPDGSSGRVFIQKIKVNPALTCVDVTDEQTCPQCGESDAPLYAVGDDIVCGDCIDRAVDARKEAESDTEVPA